MDGSADLGQSRDTRGEILSLLCISDRAISDLAGELGISSNAVRAHLNRLEGDGLVDHQVVRKGVGKPAHEYRLTVEGEASLSRAYLPLLDRLLVEMEARWSGAEVVGVLRSAGHALGSQYPSAGGSPIERTRKALGLLSSMGGMGSVEEEDGMLVIRDACCPIGAIAPEHPLACRAIEAMLTASMGVPVHENCDRSGRPSCRFEIHALGM
jgi:predicted ArsR family transcriptional regulator